MKEEAIFNFEKF